MTKFWQITARNVLACALCLAILYRRGAALLLLEHLVIYFGAVIPVQLWWWIRTAQQVVASR